MKTKFARPDLHGHLHEVLLDLPALAEFLCEIARREQLRILDEGLVSQAVVLDLLRVVIQIGEEGIGRTYDA